MIRTSSDADYAWGFATEGAEPKLRRQVADKFIKYGSAWAYLAALDVHRVKVFGRCEATTGIVPFERLVDQVMSQAPYNTAPRVFWVMDKRSSHRGQASIRCLTQAHPRLVPIHAIWLNQIEIYFSIIQRKVLTPNDFPSLQAVAKRLANFERCFAA
ncbi:MAG: transposase [Rhodoferax sp.]